MTINVGIVGMIPTESIIVGDRAREEMGDLDSFESNMKEAGLISPLAVKDNQNGTYTLLAGERRFVILKRNEVDDIPVRIYEQDLTEIEMKVIEKSENFFRKDMEYWEFDKLVLEIQTMQQELHGAKAPGPGDTGWGTEDTGEMMGGMSKAAVSGAVRRAESREAFPALFDSCKTQSDAIKVLKKVDEAMVKHTIAQKLESSKSEGALHEISNGFILEDFFKGVKQIPDKVMHLVEVDPPYGIELAKAKKIEDGESVYTMEDYNEIGHDFYGDFLIRTLKECYRVMTDHSWLIFWFAPEPWFNVVHALLKDTGFETTRMCGIWTKPSGQSKRPEMHLANSYEMFFYAWKGRPALNKAGRSNNFNYPPVPANQKTHPTERPIELTTEIYDTFAFPGSRILIPFLGSGNGLFSAQALGMSAVGFELGKSYKDSFLVKAHLMK